MPVQAALHKQGYRTVSKEAYYSHCTGSCAGCLAYRSLQLAAVDSNKNVYIDINTHPTVADVDR